MVLMILQGMFVEVSEQERPEEQIKDLLLMYREVLSKALEPIDFSLLTVRTANAIKYSLCSSAGAVCIGDLACWSEHKVRRRPGIGKKTIDEIKEKILQPKNLDFGIYGLGNWPGSRDPMRDMILSRIKSELAKNTKSFDFAKLRNLLVAPKHPSGRSADNTIGDISYAC